MSAVCRACGKAALLLACELGASESAVHRLEPLVPRALVDVLVAFADTVERAERSMLLQGSPLRLDATNWLRARLLAVVPLLLGEPEL